MVPALGLGAWLICPSPQVFPLSFHSSLSFLLFAIETLAEREDTASRRSISSL